MKTPQITAEVLAHSKCGNHELVTFKTRFPKFILAEFNTHRALSRNSASTRAIPIKRQIANVEDDMFIPTWVGKNQRGMSSATELSSVERDKFDFAWRSGMEACADEAGAMLDMGVHKQHAGRCIEPWAMVDHISSATEWANFFRLRCNAGAQPEIQELAYKMLKVLDDSIPNELSPGEWHLPFTNHISDDLTIEQIIQINVARCARISYQNFDGKIDIQKDFDLFENLLKSRHMSPFEHVARATGEGSYANFRGFCQIRTDIEVKPDPFTRDSMMDLLSDMPKWILNNME